MKRKKYGMIPIQTTAVARRRFKLRGRTLAFQGRPRARAGVTQSRQGDVTDPRCVRHKLPPKKRKVVASHSLNEAVMLNKRATKKH